MAKLGLVASAVVLLVMFAGPSVAAAATGTVTTTHWKSGSTEGYRLDATVTIAPGLGLATVTMGGPSVTAGTPLTPDLSGTTYTTSIDFAAKSPVLDSAYTLNVTYVDGTSAPETLTARVTNVLAALPTPVTPVGAIASSATPTFAWSAPAVVPADSFYNISVTGPNLQWETDVPSSETSVAYSGAALAPGVTYEWAVTLVDGQGNRAEHRSSFMLGANFTGRVTNLSGTGLAGVAIDVTDLDGSVRPQAFTAADGTYVYGGLPTGSYKISFSTDTASVYYSNQLDFLNANTLQLTAGVLTTNVNAVLGGWGAITGSVFLGSAGRPVDGVQIALYSSSRVLISSVPAITILQGGTSAFGNFQMNLLPPGSYNLKLTAAGYLDKWVPVTVTANLTQNVGVTMSSGVPTIRTFTVPATSSSLTVTGITVEAIEYSGVSGYLLTESSVPPSATAAGWSPTPPTSFTFSGAGTRTVYAYAKGSTGLVSAGTPRTVTITLASTVTVATAGAGSGTVTSTPAGISCISGSGTGCSASFAGGSTVALVPTPSSSSVFGGWAGACTGTGTCQVTIDGAKSVTATFNLKPATVRIDGNTTYFYNVGPALDAISLAGQTVRAKSQVFAENVIVTKPLAVQFKGGYTDDAFSVRGTTSMSTISGSLKVRQGTLRVERIVVR